jgi:hypothetical protein
MYGQTKPCWNELIRLMSFGRTTAPVAHFKDRRYWLNAIAAQAESQIR